MIALLSIKPEFAERIFDGTKKYEYRKNIFARKDIDKVVLYASSPLMQVIGEFEFDTIIRDTPSIIWEKTSFYSGINRDRFFEYFSGRQNAYAIRIINATRYQKALKPKNISPDFIPPQSFRYFKPEESLLLNRIIREADFVH